MILIPDYDHKLLLLLLLQYKQQILDYVMLTYLKFQYRVLYDTLSTMLHHRKYEDAMILLLDSTCKHTITSYICEYIYMLMYEDDVMNYYPPRKRKRALGEEERVDFMCRVLQHGVVWTASVEEQRARRTLYSKLCQLFQVPFRSARFHVYFGNRSDDRVPQHQLIQLAKACATRGSEVQQLQGLYHTFQLIEPFITIHQYLDIVNLIPLIIPIQSLIPLLPTYNTCCTLSSSSSSSSSKYDCAFETTKNSVIITDLLIDWYHQRARQIYKYTGQLMESKKLLCQAVSLLHIVDVDSINMQKEEEKSSQCRLLDFLSEVSMEIESIYMHESSVSSSLDEIDVLCSSTPDSSLKLESSCLPAQLPIEQCKVCPNESDIQQQPQSAISIDSVTDDNPEYDVTMINSSEHKHAYTCCEERVMGLKDIVVDNNDSVPVLKNMESTYVVKEDLMDSSHCESETNDDDVKRLHHAPFVDVINDNDGWEIMAECRVNHLAESSREELASSYLNKANVRQVSFEEDICHLSMISPNVNDCKPEIADTLDACYEEVDRCNGSLDNFNDRIEDDLVWSFGEELYKNPLLLEEKMSYSDRMNDLCFPNYTNPTENDISDIKSDINDSRHEKCINIQSSTGQSLFEYTETNKSNEELTMMNHLLSTCKNSDFVTSTRNDMERGGRIQHLSTVDTKNEMQRYIDELESKLRMNDATHSMVIESTKQKMNEEKHQEIRLARESVLDEAEKRIGDYILQINMEVADTLFKADEEIKRVKRLNLEYEEIIVRLEENMITEQIKSSRKMKVLECRNAILQKQLDLLEEKEQVTINGPTSDYSTENFAKKNISSINSQSFDLSAFWKDRRYFHRDDRREPCATPASSQESLGSLDDPSESLSVGRSKHHRNSAFSVPASNYSH